MDEEIPSPAAQDRDDSGVITVIPSEAKEPLPTILRHPATWHSALVNDFERSIFPHHPEIAALKEEFYRRGAIYAAMSGSGSAVFALFPAIA